VRIAYLLRKYADLDPDWADIALVWLAESSGIHRIATLDVADFSVYRVNGRKRFELELLR
jgi:predicted nucleic acid-binding protein